MANSTRGRHDTLRKSGKVDQEISPSQGNTNEEFLKTMTLIQSHNKVV